MNKRYIFELGSNEPNTHGSNNCLERCSIMAMVLTVHKTFTLMIIVGSYGWSSMSAICVVVIQLRLRLSNEDRFCGQWSIICGISVVVLGQGWGVTLTIDKSWCLVLAVSEPLLVGQWSSVCVAWGRYDWNGMSLFMGILEGRLGWKMKNEVAVAHCWSWRVLCRGGHRSSVAMFRSNVAGVGEGQDCGQDCQLKIGNNQYHRRVLH